MAQFKFEIGGYAYLGKEVVEYANEDHPTFLMGKLGEKVKLLEKRNNLYLVEGPTNDGNPWWCSVNDMMHTKPMFRD